MSGERMGRFRHRRHRHLVQNESSQALSHRAVDNIMWRARRGAEIDTIVFPPYLHIFLFRAISFVSFERAIFFQLE
jgi:hypothetical protein